MTARREAVLLPVIFLTVVLLGGLRVGGTTELRPPSVFALILGVLLLRLLVQSGTLAPDRLLSSSRSLLANLNGAVVLASSWIAGAQAFALLTPEAGLPRLVVNAFFLVLLVNTAAAAPDRRRLLRSLAVTFGSAFLVKFVILAELSSPGTGWRKRVLQVLLEGVTLGALTQEVSAPITGYIALLAVGLFLLGVFLLPYRAETAQSGELAVRRPARGELVEP
jgi:hypothetical protein